jgi:hypothetical protein
MGKRLMITVEQNGERLKETEADIDRDEDIARVVRLCSMMSGGKTGPDRSVGS